MYIIKIHLIHLKMSLQLQWKDFDFVDTELSALDIKDGKYDIAINLISLGDVIESLKANNLLGSPSTLTPSEQQAKQAREEQEKAYAAELEKKRTVYNPDLNSSAGF